MVLQKNPSSRRARNLLETESHLIRLVKKTPPTDVQLLAINFLNNNNSSISFFPVNKIMGLSASNDFGFCMRGCACISQTTGLTWNYKRYRWILSKYGARWVKRPVFVDTIEVAKPKVTYLYWSSKNPEFLVAKPKVAKNQQALYVFHFVPCGTFCDHY